jgi:hypothetical protein
MWSGCKARGCDNRPEWWPESAVAGKELTADGADDTTSLQGFLVVDDGSRMRSRCSTDPG